MMELVSEAVAFAVHAHDGMKRKCEGIPYILHPLEVAVIVGTMTDDAHIISAAVLHDTVEDAGVTHQQIEERFGRRVAELVLCETENKRADLPPESTWRIRKEESLKVLRETDDIAVLMLWLGDKLSNVRSLYRQWQRNGIDMWRGFNQKDPAEQAWYYTTVADLTARLCDYGAWQEYKALTDLMFRKGN